MKWQCQNEASIQRPAKEFTDDHKRVREWCQCYSILKAQTRGMLGKCCCLRCDRPLSVDLDHRVSGGQEKRRQIDVEPACVTVCNLMFLCQHLGMPRKRGRICKIKCQIWHITPPLRFRLALRLQNGGRVCMPLWYYDE